MHLQLFSVAFQTLLFFSSSRILHLCLDVSVEGVSQIFRPAASEGGDGVVSCVQVDGLFEHLLCCRGRVISDILSLTIESMI